ncbi:glycosyltransferase [Ignavibacterium album]|uniref:glycosyltransferase n=1 Tax=Ignavibacterium album TaxID=591197 RepID=UPI0035B888B4
MHKILILSDWFYPAYKAGGPITSLKNLVNVLREMVKVSVLTSAYDLGEHKILDNIVPDVWQQAGDKTRIKYLTNSKKIITELEKEEFDTIYLNSMFSPDFTLKPLLFAKRKGILNKIILAPRGMLQAGALKQKPLKKKAFLLFFRLTGIANKIHFHATDEQEKEDILKVFPKAKKITVIPNPVSEPSQDKRLKACPEFISGTKEKRKLQLVYLSVISSKKNLKYLIELFSKINFEIDFDVYGSIKDKTYWDSFVEQIKVLKNINFNYKGDVPNHLVTETLSKYDYFILPTLGENFGHAIYEALSTGTPVIISDKTPWQNLEHHKAGWDISLDNPEAFIEVLNKCAGMDNEEYQQWSKGAFNFAKKYYEEHDVTEDYLRMFEVYKFKE